MRFHPKWVNESQTGDNKPLTRDNSNTEQLSAGNDPGDASEVGDNDPLTRDSTTCMTCAGDRGEVYNVDNEMDARDVNVDNEPDPVDVDSRCWPEQLASHTVIRDGGVRRKKTWKSRETVMDPETARHGSRRLQGR